VVIGIALHFEPQVSLSKNGQNTNNLQIVSHISLQVALMLHQQALMAIDDARLERQLGSRFVDYRSCAVCYLLQQLQQVDFVGAQPWVCFFGADVLYYDLAAR
jgi:hypothetical protein